MKDRKVMRSFVMISQIGISMMVPVFLCAVIGRWISRCLHQELWLLLFLIIGMGASLRNLFVLTRSFYEKDAKKEQEQREYIEELKRYHHEHPEEDFSHVMEGKKKRYPDPKGPARS